MNFFSRSAAAAVCAAFIAGATVSPAQAQHGPAADSSARSPAPAAHAHITTPQPYRAFESLIGAWDAGAPGSPPQFVERISWGPNRGYVWMQVSLLNPGQPDHLHFEGMVHWNAANRNFDYLFTVEPGSLGQESGQMRFEADGSLVREVALTGANGSVERFRQTIRPTGANTAVTSLMRQAADGTWAPNFPGSDNLVIVRRQS